MLACFYLTFSFVAVPKFGRTFTISIFQFICKGLDVTSEEPWTEPQKMLCMVTSGCRVELSEKDQINCNFHKQITCHVIVLISEQF